MSDAPSILVVDDDPDMCWAMGHILLSHGCEVNIVSQGMDALDLVQQTPPSLIFMDAKLPDMDGLDVARLIHQRNPGIRIVMVSGYYYADDPAIREAVEQNIINGFIAKPFARGDILQAVEDHSPS